MKKFSKIVLATALATVAPAVAGNVLEKVASEPKNVSESLKSVSSDRTVLAEKQLAKGVTKRVVRDARGRVFCDMVRNGQTTSLPQVIKAPMKAPDNASFFENFESHAGQLDWLPEGWTEINTPENLATPEMCEHNINNTWSVQDTGDGYWTAITTDGVKECWIHFTYGWSYKDDEGNKIEGAAAPQDEWLITPAIDVQQNHDLFFLGEVDLGGVFSYDWSTYAYDRSIIDCDLEVLATEDDGANWTSLWKLSDDVCSDMTDAEMYDVMAELAYHTFRVDLSAYYGKNIKLAFRYINANHGFSGNSAAVDAVTVAAPAAEAMYNIPDGSLLAGISKELHVYTQSYALMPAYADVNWAAASNAYTEQNAWTFYDVDGEVKSQENGDVVTVNYPYSGGKAVAWPTLTASNANSSDNFTYDKNDAEKGGIFFGGRVPDILENEPVYVGNYDYQHKRMNTPFFETGSYVYGTSAAGTWGQGIKEIAFGNFFPAPAAPITVSDVVLTLGEFDADDDAEFLLEIYPVNEQGQLSATPAVTSTIHGSDIDGFGFYNAIFPLETPYVMEGHTLIMVSGFADNDKVREFAACAQAINNDAAHNYAYMMFDINGQKSLYAASDALQEYSSALLLSLDGTFHFLKTNDEIVDLDNDTNAYEMLFEASNAPENWWIVDGENKLPLVAEGTAYDWLTATPVTKEDGSYAVRFSAEGSQNSRAKTVVIANDGGKAQVRVRQSGTNGVGAIESGKVALSVKGDVLSIAGAEAGVRIDVISVSGVNVASGIDSVNISGLAKGVYLVRAAGKTYRIVR